MTADTDHLFLAGLAFLLMAGMALVFRGRADARLPWAWLALFGLAQALHAWLGAWAPDGRLALQALHTLLLAASLAGLVEFGRRGLRATGYHVPGRWIYLPLGLLVILGAGAGGLRGLCAMCGYLLALPGGLAAGLALWQAARGATPRQRTGLRVAAAASLAYALAAGLAVPKAAFFPASRLNDAAFYATTGVAIELVRALCALAALAGLWLYDRACAFGSAKASAARRWFVPAAFLLVLALYWTTGGFGLRPEEAALRSVSGAGAATAAGRGGTAAWGSLDIAPADGDNRKPGRFGMALTMLLMVALGEGFAIGLSLLLQRRNAC